MQGRVVSDDREGLDGVVGVAGDGEHVADAVVVDPLVRVDRRSRRQLFRGDLPGLPGANRRRHDHSVGDDVVGGQPTSDLARVSPASLGEGTRHVGRALLGLGVPDENQAPLCHALSLARPDARLNRWIPRTPLTSLVVAPSPCTPPIGRASSWVSRSATSRRDAQPRRWWCARTWPTATASATAAMSSPSPTPRSHSRATPTASAPWRQAPTSAFSRRWLWATGWSPGRRSARAVAAPASTT